MVRRLAVLALGAVLVAGCSGNPAAQRFSITGGGGGAQRSLYQLPGEVNGKAGIFEWIVDESGSNPVIDHQRFIPGGEVTGYPNQRP
jgi:hypothetical protein